MQKIDGIRIQDWFFRCDEQDKICVIIIIMCAIITIYCTCFNTGRGFYFLLDKNNLVKLTPTTSQQFHHDFLKFQIS